MGERDYLLSILISSINSILTRFANERKCHVLETRGRCSISFSTSVASRWMSFGQWTIMLNIVEKLSNPIHRSGTRRERTCANYPEVESRVRSGGYTPYTQAQQSLP